MSGPTTNDPNDLSAVDLLRHGGFTLKLYGRDETWIGAISGPITEPDPPLTLHIKNLTIMGTLSVILDRLSTAVDLLERARDHPEQWDLLLPRLPRGTPRTWPHPFCDPPSPTPEPATVETR